jgi:hypothetical protein
MSPACSNSTTTMCSMSYAPSREKQSNSNLREREGQRWVGDLAALRPPYWRSRPRGSFASHLEADFRTASRRGPVLNVPAGHVVCCQVRSGLAPGRWIRTLGPPWRDPIFKSAHQWLRAVHNELCDRRNDQVLDVAKFKQGDGANEAGFAGIAPKNYWK